MSNTNTNLQTQTSNALYNAIMEASGKYRPPMLAPNPPYKFKWTAKTILVLEGGSETTTEGDGESLESYYSRFYKMMNELVRNQCYVTNHQVDVQFLLQLQPEWQRGKAIVNSPPPTYDQEPEKVAEDDEMSKDKANQDNSIRINKGTWYDNQRVLNVAGARENVAYHKEQMLLCKQEEARFKLNADQVDFSDVTDDEYEYQELEAHYLYMAQIQEVTPDDVDNSGPILDAEPLQKVQNNDDNYNVFAIESEHHKQPEYVNDTYPVEQDEHNIIIDSLDMSYDRKQDDQDDNDLAREQMKNELFAYQETISIMSQEKEAQIKFYKTREDKEIEKVITLENKVKALDDIIYKTGQLVETMNMLNRNYKTSFVKPEFLKKAQRANPRKPSTFSDSLAKKDFSKPVTAQILSQNVKPDSKNTNVIAPGIKCVLNDNHDMCVLHFINGVNSRTKMPIFVPISTREPKRTMNQSATTPLKRIVAAKSTNQKPRSKHKKQYEQISKTCKWWYSKFTPPGYQWKPKSSALNVKPNVSLPLGKKSRNANILKSNTIRRSTLSNIHCLLILLQLIDIILFIIDYGCSKHMMGNLKLLSNFVEKFLGTVKFGNDQIALILGYGDLAQGNVTIKRVYYVEGLNHNLFSDGQFCDADLEVAVRKSTCCIHDLKGNDLLTGYSTQSKGYRVYNKRTRVIVETIHVNFNELPLMVSDHVSSDPVPQSETVTTSNELDLLFTLMFNELFNGSTPVVSKSSAVPAADAPDKRQQQNTTPSTLTTVVADTPPLNIQTSPEPISQAPIVTNTENINQAKIQVENAQVDKDEFSTSLVRRYLNKGRHLLDMLIRQSCIHSINDILLNTVGQEITC
ncbi:hypothetical protein Tco_0670849 [Tanacetum coccineum]